eukprot:364072-Chlamydomonas_euryale.AAC.13
MRQRPRWVAVTRRRRRRRPVGHVEAAGNLRHNGRRLPWRRRHIVALHVLRARQRRVLRHVGRLAGEDALGAAPRRVGAAVDVAEHRVGAVGDAAHRAVKHTADLRKKAPVAHGGGSPAGKEGAGEGVLGDVQFDDLSPNHQPARKAPVAHGDGVLRGNRERGRAFLETWGLDGLRPSRRPAKLGEPVLLMVTGHVAECDEGTCRTGQNRRLGRCRVGSVGWAGMQEIFFACWEGALLDSMTIRRSTASESRYGGGPIHHGSA